MLYTEETGLVEGTRLNHRSGELTLTGEQTGSVEGPGALEDTGAFEGLADHITDHHGQGKGLPTAGFGASKRYSRRSLRSRSATEEFSGVRVLLSNHSETLTRSASRPNRR